MFGNNLLSFIVTVSLSLLASFVLPAAPSSSAALGSGDALVRTLSARASAPGAALTVALGANVCVDLVASARNVLGDAAAAVATPADAASCADEAAAASALVFFARAGAAAERTADAALLATLVARADASGDARRSLGGNAALMARAIVRAKAAAAEARGEVRGCNGAPGVPGDESFEGMGAPLSAA